MKKILSAFIACLALASCQTNEKKDSANNSTTDTQKDCVEVICFHNKQRCATCIATEQNTKAAIDSIFAEQLKTGEVVFRNIDISESENEEIANKYQVTWSSLYIVKHKDGKETTKNLTRFAFANARNAPDKFKSEVIKEVNKMLEE